MNAPISLESKIKNKIMNDFNTDLYRNLNMTISDANDLFGWGHGYMYKIMDRVFENYGPAGLRGETKYIIRYLDFLLIKLKNICSFDITELPYSNRNYDFEFYEQYFVLMYFLKYYRHYGQRKVSNPDQLSFGFLKNGNQ